MAGSVVYAYRATNLAIAVKSWEHIPYDTEIHDPDSIYNAGTQKLTAPADGIVVATPAYHVQGSGSQTNMNQLFRFNINNVGQTPYGGACGPFRNLPNCNNAMSIAVSSGDTVSIDGYSDLGEDWEGTTDTYVSYLFLPDGDYSMEVNQHGIAGNRAMTSAWTQYYHAWDRVIHGNDDRLEADTFTFTMTENAIVWATVQVKSTASAGGDDTSVGGYVGIDTVFGTATAPGSWRNVNKVDLPCTHDFIFPVAIGEGVIFDHRTTISGFTMQGYDHASVDYTKLTMRIIT
jgi:hypothetical protein